MKGALLTKLLILLTINMSCAMGEVWSWKARQRWRMQMARHMYKCPPISNNSPAVLPSPSDVLTSIHKSDIHHSHVAMPPIKIHPLSVRAFNNLQMFVLPNRQICVYGRKITNFLLPDDRQTQYGIMRGIAIWFAPCTQPTPEMKKKQCFKRQMALLNKLDMSQVSSLHQLLLRFLRFQGRKYYRQKWTSPIEE